MIVVRTDGGRVVLVTRAKEKEFEVTFDTVLDTGSALTIAAWLSAAAEAVKAGDERTFTYGVAD